MVRRKNVSYNRTQFTFSQTRSSYSYIICRPTTGMVNDMSAFLE